MNDQVTTLKEIKGKVRQFRAERGWLETDPKDVALSIVLEAAEILEQFQWVKTEEVIKNPKWRQAVGEEIADVLYLLSELVTELEIDIAEAFEQKLAKLGKKYPIGRFRPDMSKTERMKEYYQIKAQTRGGFHPLVQDEEDNE